MADGKIYITISDTRKGGVGVDGKKPTEKKTMGETINEYAKHRFYSMIKTQTQQAVSYTVANIGNFTGDYVAQRHISDALEVTNGLVSIGMSAFAGFKIAGGWGAVIGAGIDIAGRTISAGQQIYAGYVDNVRQNRAIDQLRNRAGLNSTENGNRGTEN